MKSIADILPKDFGDSDKKPSRKTERGELMRFFVRHLNHSRSEDGWGVITMARMGKILEGIPTADLYYLKTVCSRAKNFSKKFWWEVDPEKHFQQKDAPF